MVSSIQFTYFQDISMQAIKCNVHSFSSCKLHYQHIEMVSSAVRVHVVVLMNNT